MTRIAIIHKHVGVPAVVTHADATPDQEILAYAANTFGPLHSISRVQICEIVADYSNTTPIENWLKTTKRLTQ